ncbi:unnamed protein product [Allacma fusca]|uniref:Uncharacterized protein n=1 Tax=Allacma fusca TaxID=39272 RepID=A0A8J2LLC0_9HEXA|nr:unnamed protein product [Allacma fusca]
MRTGTSQQINTGKYCLGTSRLEPDVSTGTDSSSLDHNVPTILALRPFFHVDWTGRELLLWLAERNTIRNSVSTCVCICWIAVHLEIIYRLSVSVTLAGSDGVFCQQYGIYRLEL